MGRKLFIQHLNCLPKRRTKYEIFSLLVRIQELHICMSVGVFCYELKLKYAVSIVAKGTDKLSSTLSVIGRDSTIVATNATTATL